MFIVKVTYKVPLAEVDKYLQAHREYLDDYYRKGALIASGPLKPRTGGIILVATNDKSLVETIIQKDPFYLAEIADYELIEFTPVKHCDILKDLIEKTEGKLC